MAVLDDSHEVCGHSIAAVADDEATDGRRKATSRVQEEEAKCDQTAATDPRGRKEAPLPGNGKVEGVRKMSDEDNIRRRSKETTTLVTNSNLSYSCIPPRKGATRRAGKLSKGEQNLRRFRRGRHPDERQKETKLTATWRVDGEGGFAPDWSDDEEEGGKGSGLMQGTHGQVPMLSKADPLRPG